MVLKRQRTTTKNDDDLYSYKVKLQINVRDTVIADEQHFLNSFDRGQNARCAPKETCYSIYFKINSVITN